MSQLGRGIEVGPLEARQVEFSLSDYSWDMHRGKEII